MTHRLFISYKRDDTKWVVKNIYINLLKTFPKEQIFLDIDTIPFGDDFVRIIEDAVSKCDILIAVIGKNWASSLNAFEKLTANTQPDYVRLEIVTAFKNKIKIIPLLVDETSMPHSFELPDDLKSLSRINAIEIRHNRFDADMDHLTTVLNKFLQDIDLNKKNKELENQKQAELEKHKKLNENRNVKLAVDPTLTRNLDGTLATIFILLKHIIIGLFLGLICTIVLSLILDFIGVYKERYFNIIFIVSGIVCAIISLINSLSKD